jgi:hypothetical protein
MLTPGVSDRKTAGASRQNGDDRPNTRPRMETKRPGNMKPPIDEGLDRLLKTHIKGQCLTYEAIAAECKCRWSAIQTIETRALRKLRAKLRNQR